MHPEYQIIAGKVGGEENVTLKPEHIVEELNRTPKLKRDLIMKMVEAMLDSEAFLEAYPRLYDPEVAEVSPEYREQVREELAQIIIWKYTSTPTSHEEALLDLKQRCSW